MFQMFWNVNDIDKCMKMRKHATYQLDLYLTFSLGGYSHMECQYSSDTLKIHEMKALFLYTISKHSIHLRRASVSKFIGRGLDSSAFDHSNTAILKPHIKAHDSHPGLQSVHRAVCSGQINK